MTKLSRISFGSTAAIVTSMALITGLEAAGVAKSTVVSALLIAALADNLTDSLSIHMYQESERLEQREAFIGTLSNFATRFVGCLSFVVIVAICPPAIAVWCAIVWGMMLLIVLSYLLARARNVSEFPEMVKHVIVAVAVLFVSKGIALWLA